jgi:hypothetical protein
VLLLVFVTREERRMGQMVIAVYRPQAGKESILLDLVREHVPLLRAQGLVTERQSLVMRAKDGTLVEIFEWLSPAAAHQAQENVTVLTIWEKFNDVCSYECIGNLEESQQLFSPFEPIDF